MGKSTLVILFACVLALLFMSPCAQSRAVSKPVAANCLSPIVESRAMLAPLPGADEDGDEDEDSDSRAGGFVREGPIVSLHADASTDVAPTSASLKNPSAGSGGDEDEDGDEDTDAGSR